MKNRAASVLLLAAGIALVAGLTWIFRLRVASGDLFPRYSSFRADPLGTRALHDALAELPGLQVDRHVDLLTRLPAQPSRVIILAGTHRRDWSPMPEPAFVALDAAVRAGSRLVVAFHAEEGPVGTEEAAPGGEGKQAPKHEAKEKTEKEKTEEEKPEPMAPRLVDVGTRWGFEVKRRDLNPLAGGATRVADGALVELPAQLTWHSDLHFVTTATADWRVIYRRGPGNVMVERRLGKGSIVLCADSYFLSNEALQTDRSTALLVWLLGSHRVVTFDEGHLGVTTNAGVAALARRYGLSGAFFTFVLLGLLFAWQQAATFVPPSKPRDEIAMTYHPAAGLESLLRRAIATDEVLTTCVAEWRRTASPHDVARVEAALAANATAPVEVRYNAALRALRRR